VSQEFRHFKRQNFRLLNTAYYGIAETPIETGALHDSISLSFAMLTWCRTRTDALALNNVDIVVLF